MKKAELVFIPLPGMGHLVSTVELAKHLLDLNSHLYTTFLIIKPTYDTKVTAYVDSLAANTNITTSRIKFIILPQPEIDKDVPPAKFISSLAETLRPVVKEAITNMVQLSLTSSVPDSPRLAGFVLDMFHTPLKDLADEFGVPSYVFYTSGAAFLGFQFYMHAFHDEQNVDISKLKDSDTEFTIPSYVNPVSTKFFPPLMDQPDVFAAINNVARRFREVKGITVNTFSELESHALNSFSEDGGRFPPIYPVGPLLNLEGASDVHQNFDPIMKWLDEQPPSSVVFLCFGSRVCFGADQVREIACALEQSGHRFLWSLRQPPDPAEGAMGRPTDYDNEAEVLHEGFLHRTVEIGKIIGWAPQVEILGHPAIGGFVSHCGWNSILESIWFGVPIATWPLSDDKQLNSFELVIQLGLAVEIKMDYKIEVVENNEVEIVSAEKIKRGISCLMEPNSNVRKKVKEISEKSRKALMDGGSSHTALCHFINHVLDNMG
ncbi:hypothetical protein PTKIN_Ptkin12aG0010800 [Pterospermum kingtungense]